MATVSIRLGISLQEEAGAVLVGAGILIWFYALSSSARGVGLRASPRLCPRLLWLTPDLLDINREGLPP